VPQTVVAVLYMVASSGDFTAIRRDLLVRLEKGLGRDN
jgi:hypothetical protein